MEIERKFLVTQPPAGLEREPGDRIEQGYLAIDAVAEVRLRRRVDERTLTVKSEPRRTRVEEEIELDDARFAALWPLTEGRRVVKTRREIPHEGAVIEVDVYHGDLTGLVTAEVEFDSEEAADAFEPPDWLGTEVTGDARYANRTLATEGRPDDVAG
jgi:adenylate cyclase